MKLADNCEQQFTPTLLNVQYKKKMILGYLKFYPSHPIIIEFLVNSCKTSTIIHFLFLFLLNIDGSFIEIIIKKKRCI